jgi:hypothetical protein
MEINDTIFTVGFSLIGTVLATLLAVIGYFLKEFGEQVKQLKFIVQELQITMGSEKSRSDSYWKACETKHGLLDEMFKTVHHKIDAHGNKIAEQGLDIAVIKNELSL